jgi:hypothetical protein
MKAALASSAPRQIEGAGAQAGASSAEPASAQATEPAGEPE